eukprot:TRINITY_DN27095_c0_g1_i1.p1 TRINITY_DN27095_c0_g1~~TRINITY_DN27095_c0_g1_i1.p1  ORF type:complete len:249 (+),score=1.99 TRINITY_DN27095_c0_g1_i1:66-812(+)
MSSHGFRTSWRLYTNKDAQPRRLSLSLSLSIQMCRYMASRLECLCAESYYRGSWRVFLLCTMPASFLVPLSPVTAAMPLLLCLRRLNHRVYKDQFLRAEILEYICQKAFSGLQDAVACAASDVGRGRIILARNITLAPYPSADWPAKCAAYAFIPPGIAICLESAAGSCYRIRHYSDSNPANNSSVLFVLGEGARLTIASVRLEIHEKYKNIRIDKPRYGVAACFGDKTDESVKLQDVALEDRYWIAI